MIDQNVDDEMKFFVDTNINSFIAEVLFLEDGYVKSSLVQEIDLKSKKEDLWTM